MGRPSSIGTHPQREAIEQAIAAGVRGSDIARRYGVSESAISRWSVARKDAISRVAGLDSIDPASVIARLLDLADDARHARKLAAISGTPATRARAQSAELSVLTTLIERTGIDETASASLYRGATDLVTVIQRIALNSAEDAEHVLTLLREHESLSDLADALAANIKEQA
ncbi:transposase [Microbacterium sp. B24]|uniref:transposase n=1 Tax=Microbacterium sp. B24 TaxID=95616 RepID=UPI000A057088|nr:transposase [Microbacterium sp. B24]